MRAYLGATTSLILPQPSGSSPEGVFEGACPPWEEAWIAHHAKPNIHDDPFRNVVGPQSQDNHLRVLEQYRSIVPALLFLSDKESAVVYPLASWPLTLATSSFPPMTMPRSCQHHWLARLLGGTTSISKWTHPSLCRLQRWHPIWAVAEFPKLPENFWPHGPCQTVAIVRADHRAKMLHKLYEIEGNSYLYQIDALKETRAMLRIRAAGSHMERWHSFLYATGPPGCFLSVAWALPVLMSLVRFCSRKTMSRALWPASGTGIVNGTRSSMTWGCHLECVYTDGYHPTNIRPRRRYWITHARNCLLLSRPRWRLLCLRIRGGLSAIQFNWPHFFLFGFLRVSYRCGFKRLDIWDLLH